jgi:drug/metabolite transporter (DMT)-like permease
MRARHDGLGIVLLASVLFGVMAVFVRLAAEALSASQVAFFRFAGSFLVLIVVTRGAGLRRGTASLGRLLLRSIIGTAAIVLYFVGIRGAGAGLATLLQNSYPVFATIFAALVLGEPFSRRLGLALGLSFAGIAVVVGPDLRLGSAAALGAIAAAASAVLAGAAVVAARDLRRTENASRITTYFMGVGALVTAPALLAGPLTLSPRIGLALVAVVLTSVAGQWLLHHALGFASATRASLVAATSVVTAAGLEALWLGQALRAHALAGACLMIVAIALAGERGGTAVPAALVGPGSSSG